MLPYLGCVVRAEVALLSGRVHNRYRPLLLQSQTLQYPSKAFLQTLISNDVVKLVVRQAAPIVIGEPVEPTEESRELGTSFSNEAKSLQIGPGHMAATLLEFLRIGIVAPMVCSVLLIQTDALIERIPDSREDEVSTFLSSSDAQELMIVCMFAQHWLAIVVLTQLFADRRASGVREFNE
jgi:hypothetical protein